MLDNGIIFDARIAEKFSVEEAIVINKLFGWIKHNATNGKNFKEGRYWTFNSISAFKKYFPFWNESKIKRIFIDLAGCTEKSEYKPKHEPIIIKGNFNKSSFDRTIWYSFTDDFFAYLVKLGYDLNADFPQAENGYSADGQMEIPQAEEQYQLINQNNNNQRKEKTSKKKDFNFLAALLGIGIEEQIAKDWMKIRASKKASDSETAFKQLHTALETIKNTHGISFNEAISICVTNGWYGCKPSYFDNIKLADYGIGTQTSLFQQNNGKEWQ
jgi:hypothetical protein